MAHIVGWGSSEDNRKNIHTLDTSGNAWFAGGILLNSPDGNLWKITVDNSGNLITTKQ